jgi:small-conductance mechanosensitive channel/CRP-like cAMP-binding protein
VYGEGLPLIDEATLALTVMLWLAAALLASRTLTFVVSFRFKRQTGSPPPSLLTDLLSGLIWLGTLTTLSVVEFNVSPSAAVATSGVLIAVIGFAVRSLVADLFYGVTMAIERPFEIGDWVRLADGSTGRVEEMTWRAVKLVSRDNVKIVVPNAKLAMEEIVNFDQPEPYWRKREKLVLGYEVPPRQVADLLAAAVQEVPESAGVPMQPEARIVGYEEHGIEWELRFWLPDFERNSEISQKIHEAILRNMRFAGIRVPRPREEVFIAELESERASDRMVSLSWIHHVELFQPLSEQEREDLQAAAHRRSVSAGTEIVRQGEAGSSLFVIQQGSFDVLIQEGGEAPEITSTMGPGKIFGELSLLTGSPRSASVRAATNGTVFEITKAEVEPLLNNRPELARELAEVLADRRLADEARSLTDSNENRDAKRRGIVANILTGARTFFRLAA